MDIAKEMGAAARACTPVAICYECKGEGDEKCRVCKGAHYARQEQMSDVPKEKLREVRAEIKAEANGVAASA
jgi:hypothetical protein